ncbi:hypothetical protein HaLaN_25420 [Haematococcus lacustris]|uniref:Uncharacterized protein n=1 Tax=Haematococcus lacustris TaxID=44745 RepID=A0A6A0A3I6_HAELA|nr:hypothetical protein HaLaN_25420 [Haematococcus lacustris]
MGCSGGRLANSISPASIPQRRRSSHRARDASTSLSTAGLQDSPGPSSRGWRLDLLPRHHGLWPQHCSLRPAAWLGSRMWGLASLASPDPTICKCSREA